MHHDASTYDDDSELTRYIWRNCRHLLTDLERLTDRALIAEFKAEHTSSESFARTLRSRWAANDNAEVAAALADGTDAFRNRVRDRVLNEVADSLSINRCPECHRVILTPLAQQCLWCGHDWHATS